MLQDSAEEKNALSALQKQDGAVLAMEEDDAMDTVSYTHLDVYKRQGHPFKQPVPDARLL